MTADRRTDVWQRLIELAERPRSGPGAPAHGGPGLRDLELPGIEEAADGWADVSRRAGAARTRVDSGMTRKLGGTQEGEAERAAVRRLRRLHENFQYIHAECGLVRTTLDGLAQELRPLQKELNDVLDEAAALELTVHADGSVSCPAGGDQPPYRPSSDRNRPLLRLPHRRYRRTGTRGNPWSR